MRIVLMAIVLSACMGPFVPTVERNELAGTRRVPIIDRAWINEFAFREIGPVESWSCRNKLWDAESSVDNAVAQLSYKAVHEMNANALSDVECSKHESISLGTNCWDHVHCTGRALDVRLAGY